MKFLMVPLILLCLVGCLAQTTFPTNPKEAELVTDDIERFWKAYDQARVSSNPVAVFQNEYLDLGTRGLQDFFRLRIGSAEALCKSVLARQKYFDSIRQNTLNLVGNEGIQQQIRQNFAALKTLYPEARFPPTYFLIGRFTSGGTVSNAGLLLGLEFWTRADNSPLEELTPWEKSNVRPISALAFTVTHELIHTLQGRSSQNTLLAQVLREGSADFLAALASQEQPSGAYFQYGLNNEKSLWLEFREVMNGTKISDWLYQGDQATNRPSDLGYFIGYRIAQAFYQKATDKQQAVREILQILDAKAFLEQSGYEASPQVK